MKHYNKCLYLIFLSALLTAETTVSILSSSEKKLVIQLNCDLETPEDLKPIDLLIGLPNENLPQISIQSDKA